MPWIDPITGREHTGCVEGSEGDWCPLAVNEDGVFELKSKEWGLCGEDCPSDYGKTYLSLSLKAMYVVHLLPIIRVPYKCWR